MYGLINNSMRKMVLDRFGESAWQSIMQRSSVPDDSFLTMRSYDDAITFALVGAAAEELNVEADSCLKMFGEFWVHEVAAKDFAALMDATGSNIVDFLRNLNALHDRISSTFINYLPPQFEVAASDAASDIYHIHYLSKRVGMDAFVVGLLKGLANHFGDDIVIQGQTPQPTDLGTHTVFTVRVK